MSSRRSQHKRRSRRQQRLPPEPLLQSPPTSAQGGLPSESLLQSPPTSARGTKSQKSHKSHTTKPHTYFSDSGHTQHLQTTPPPTITVPTTTYHKLPQNYHTSTLIPFGPQVEPPRPNPHISSTYVTQIEPNQPISYQFTPSIPRNLFSHSSQF